MILNIPGVIHLFVALLGPILGVLLRILVSPKTLMEILIGGVGEPLNLFPQFVRGERKHPVFGLQTMAMETYSPVETWTNKSRSSCSLNLIFHVLSVNFTLENDVGEHF